MVTSVILQSVQQHIHNDGSRAWFMLFNQGPKIKIQAKQSKVLIKSFDLMKVATETNEAGTTRIIYS